jgi:hypothetical protein
MEYIPPLKPVIPHTEWRLPLAASLKERLPLFGQVRILRVNTKTPSLRCSFSGDLVEIYEQPDYCPSGASGRQILFGLPEWVLTAS